MTETIIRESDVDPESEPVEVLIREARRRGRQHRLIAGLIVAVVVAGAAIAAIVTGIGGRNLVPDRVREHHPSSHVVSAAAWAVARRTCEGRPMQAARSESAKPHLYGAYPTTNRLAINWPTRIYPIAGPPTPTTAISGQSKSHFDPWDGYNNSRPALICIFTGAFRWRVYGMGGSSLIEHANVLAMYQFSTSPIPSAISVVPMNTIPRRPVPVA